MKRHHLLSIGLVSLTLASTSGCIIIADFDPWDDCGSCIWVDGQEERLALDAAGLSGVEVKTHNGAVAFTGSSGESYVTYKVKAGGNSHDDAQAALAAIQVFNERGSDGIERLGWRWTEPKRRSWSGSVSFDIHAPEPTTVRARTHNGGVHVMGAAGDVDVETHNGSVEIHSTGQRLVAQTHNGPIEASFSGRDLTLETHNGRIIADLSACTAIDGRIVTHNGGVKVTMGSSASTTVRASTHNGGISSRVPLVESEIERRKLTGRIGDGDGSLSINTHNGSVSITDQG